MRINKEYCFFICFGRKVMLRCSLTSRQQCQCKPNAELENSFSKVMLRCSLTSRQQCQCKPNAERRELALKSYAEVQPDFAEGKDTTRVSRSPKFFSLPNIAPRKFATPSNRHSALYLRAFLRIFPHAQKKRNRDISRCSKLFYIILSKYFYFALRSCTAFDCSVFSHIARYAPLHRTNNYGTITQFKCKNNFEHLLNFLSHADAQNVRSSHVLPPPNATPTPFATDPCFFLP